jgi:AcrR family transcriptional regulator
MFEAKRRLDRDTRREAILDVARDVFLDEGFAAASMSTIAARLGGSKGTLYNYFRSKDELFAAHVARHCAWQAESMFSILSDPPDDIRHALTALCERYLAIILSEYNLLNYRLIMAEVLRSPEIGRIFYETGPLNGARRVAAFLERARDKGLLAFDDSLQVAHQLIGLCQGRLFKARLLNYSPEPNPAEISAEVGPAVATFLAAFGTEASREGEASPPPSPVSQRRKAGKLAR